MRTPRKKSPPLAAKQQRVLLTVYLWRYVTVHHVHRIAGYDTPSTTTAKLHLRQLTAAGLLKTTRLSQNEPHIYSTTATGRRLLRRAYPYLTIIESRDEATKRIPVQHELHLSDFQTALFLATSEKPHVTLGHVERRYFHDHNQLPYRDDRGQSNRLEPDLGFTLAVDDPAEPYRLHCYAEIDLGTESLPTFARKLAAYEQWSKQHEVERLRLYIVTRSRRGTTDGDRLRHLLDLAAQLPKQLRRAFYATTFDALARQGIAAPIWHSPRATAAQLRSPFPSRLPEDVSIVS